MIIHNYIIAIPSKSGCWEFEQRSCKGRNDGWPRKPQALWLAYRIHSTRIHSTRIHPTHSATLVVFSRRELLSFFTHVSSQSRHGSRRFGKHQESANTFMASVASKSYCIKLPQLLSRQRPIRLSYHGSLSCQRRLSDRVAMALAAPKVASSSFATAFIAWSSYCVKLL